MRIGLIQAAHASEGVRLPQRYHEVIDEAVLAEEVGFDFYAMAEQHFNPGSNTVTNVSTPDVMLSAIAARTTRIRLMWLSAVLPIHHPLRLAESVATLDVISNGRFELSTARSNDLPTMQAYQVNPAETRDRWAESLEIIAAALVNGEVEHEGQFWQIPRTRLNPRAIQQPAPPFFYASTSAEGHKVAGSMGLGVVGGNSLTGGWPFVEECARTYKAAVAKAKPVGPEINDQLYSFAFVAHCSHDVEQAKREAAHATDSIISMVTTMFTKLAAESKDYAYMDAIRTMYDRRHDIDFLVERAPYISIGNPEFWIERIRRLESLGFDGIVLRVDGMQHDVCERSIRLFGEEVLPAFRQGRQQPSAETSRIPRAVTSP
jgi:alkanesulfonate monooxygenase SsuD/methylene tetrahydromethanopterin reductase-like flavin-dependent oxidoreductase (luciferase family)